MIAMTTNSSMSVNAGGMHATVVSFQWAPWKCCGFGMGRSLLD